MHNGVHAWLECYTVKRIINDELYYLAGMWILDDGVKAHWSKDLYQSLGVREDKADFLLTQLRRPELETVLIRDHVTEEELKQAIRDNVDTVVYKGL